MAFCLLLGISYWLSSKALNRDQMAMRNTYKTFWSFEGKRCIRLYMKINRRSGGGRGGKDIQKIPNSQSTCSLFKTDLVRLI